jgi:hypothetical protein
MPIWRKPRLPARKETIMEPSHAETPFSQLLFRWAAYQISCITTSMKPKHLAGQISADVAASGNPTGA